jgi:hypothetical protein
MDLISIFKRMILMTLQDCFKQLIVLSESNKNNTMITSVLHNYYSSAQKLKLYLFWYVFRNN